MDKFKTFLEAIQKSKEIISFDFDNTLQSHDKEPLWPSIEKLFDYDKKGYKIIIVTARDKVERSEINNFIDVHQLPVIDIHFTCNQPKGPLLKELGVKIHVDDCPDQLASAKNHGIETIDAMKILAKDEHFCLLRSRVHKHL